MPGSSSNNNADSFESFLESWLVHQEHNYEELVTAQQNLHELSDEYLMDLTSRVLSNYQAYYYQKSMEASRNTFRVFSPPWFTSYEKTFLWVGGFKPGLAFGLVERAVGSELGEEERRRMNRLKNETKAQERELEQQMERIQMGVAGRTVLEAARERRRAEGRREVEALRKAMEGLVLRADCVRMRMAERVTEILSPAQNVKFLSAAAQLQLKIRRLGLQKDAERATREAALNIWW